MKNSLLIFCLGALLGCQPAPDFEKYIPEICFDFTEVNWTVNGGIQYQTADFMEVDRELRKDLLELMVDGSWKIELENEQYRLHLEGASLFTESILKEMGEQEWVNNIKASSEYTLTNDYLSVREFELLSEDKTLGINKKHILGGGVGIEPQVDREGCDFMVLSVFALFQDPEDEQQTYQVNLSFKTPYVYPY